MRLSCPHGSGARERRDARLLRVWCGAVALAAALCPRPAAAAEPSEQRRDQARSLATEGFEALQKKDYARAEDRFRRADALVHAPTLVVDHARALVGLGRLVEAHERYELVLREGVSPSAPWQWRKAASDAERELALLKPRLAWLTLRVTGPAEPGVRIDSRPVPLAALGVRRATDPGTHAVSVTAPGFEPKEEMVTLEEGENEVLDVVLTPAEGEPEPPRIEPEAPRPVAAPRPAEASGNTFAYVALGVGGAGIVAGIVTGAIALSARSGLAEHCPDRTCVPRSRSALERDEDAIDRYRLFGTVSGVSFAVGIAAAGTGGALLLFSSDAERGEMDANAGGETIEVESAFVAPGAFGFRGRITF